MGFCHCKGFLIGGNEPQWRIINQRCIWRAGLPQYSVGFPILLCGILANNPHSNPYSRVCPERIISYPRNALFMQKDISQNCHFRIGNDLQKLHCTGFWVSWQAQGTALANANSRPPATSRKDFCCVTSTTNKYAKSSSFRRSCSPFFRAPHEMNEADLT